MSGIKYVLRNNTTAIQFFDYKTLSDAMWFYQVSLNPGQVKTIWAELDSLKIYNNGAITIEEQSSFPPVHSDLTGGGIVKQYIDYTNKSILVFSELPDSNNLGYSILDFDNNITYGPIDLGYDNGDWSVNNIYPFTNSGYAIYLDSVEGDDASIYLDFSGQIIGEYSTYTEDRGYDILGGKFAYFIDYDNGVFNYSDGKTFKQIEFNDSSFDVDFTYDGNIKDGFIVRRTNGNFSTLTLFSMESETILYTWDNSYTNSLTSFEYQNSNFVTILNYTIDDYYTFFNIYSSTGSILQSVNLNQVTAYTNNDVSFFGDNKMTIIFYNNSDSAVPFLIYTYDGNTNTLISTTHDKVNYPDWTQQRDGLYGGDVNFPSQDIHIWFYNETGTNDSFIQNTYFDVLSYFSGDTEYREVYVVNNDNGIYVSGEYYLGSSHMLFLDDDSGFLKLLIITSEGTSTNTITQLSQLDNYYFNTWWIGDTYLFKVNTGSSAGTFYIYDALGNQLDYKLFFGGYESDYSYGTVYLVSDPNESQQSYYFNTKNLQFLPIEYYGNTITSNYYYDNTFKLTSNILLVRYEDNTPICRVLSENNLTPEVSLPQAFGEGPSFGMGKDVILYIYVNNNNRAVINLYNTSLSLLSSLVTNYNSWNNWWVVENRVSVSINDDNVINYMVSTNGIKQIESTIFTDYTKPNDYYYDNFC
jgi:hypothetical protein